MWNLESGGYSNWMIGPDQKLSSGLIQSSKTGVEIQRQGWVVFIGGQWTRDETLTIIGKGTCQKKLKKCGKFHTWEGGA